MELFFVCCSRKFKLSPVKGLNVLLGCCPECESIWQGEEKKVANGMLSRKFSRIETGWDEDASANSRFFDSLLGPDFDAKVEADADRLEQQLLEALASGLGE
ncbi:MAG: hypothetical protein PHC85_03250 [Candidatus Pacebacteria bacterium]|nr:hypothetical protein [Candidatus Paceibacterota bacterium]